MNSVSNQKVLVGGKTKKTTKCPKNCKCTKCAKKVSMKKSITKKVSKGGARYLTNQTNLAYIWNSMLVNKIIEEKKENLNKTKLYTPNDLLKDTCLHIKKENFNNSLKNENKKSYALIVIDLQNDFCDRPYNREGKVLLCQNIEENTNYRKHENPAIYTNNTTKINKTSRNNSSKNNKLPIGLVNFVHKEELNQVSGNSVPAISKLGNFNVADSGTKGEDSLISKIMKKIKYAVNDPKCKKIIFTRDYHPDGHMSFSPFLTGDQPEGSKTKDTRKTHSPYSGCTGGCFPSHCLQGHNGSYLINEIMDYLDYEQNNYNRNSNLLKNFHKKVEILFKGFDSECDSFTGVNKKIIDNYASNTNSNKSCSSISGSYQLIKNGEVNYLDSLYFNDFIIKEGNNYNIYELNDNTFNSKFGNSRELKYQDKELKHNNDFELISYDFKPLLRNVDEIQVCGLAGDYCVRDTIKALAEKNTKKDVVLLGGLTRYAVLPLFTMKTVPIHNYQTNMNVPTIDSMNYEQLNEKKVIDNFNETTNQKKSLYYYALENKGKYKLIDTIEKGFLNFNYSPKKNLLKNKISADDLVIGAPPTKFHFITPPEEIIKDFIEKSNIKVRLYEDEFLFKEIIGSTILAGEVSFNEYSLNRSTEKEFIINEKEDKYYKVKLRGNFKKNNNITVEKNKEFILKIKKLRKPINIEIKINNKFINQTYKSINELRKDFELVSN